MPRIVVVSTLGVLLCLGAVGSTRAQPSTARPAPLPLWTAQNIGYSRQLTLAVSPTHAFVAEAYMISVIDRATGAVTVVDSEAYLPVVRAHFAAGRLWLVRGADERAADAPPEIVSLDPAASAVTRVATTHSLACGLRLVDGELFWVDQSGEHVHHAAPGRRARSLAPPPSGYRYDPNDCRQPLAVDGDAIYVLAAPDVAAFRAHLLLRVPRDGSAPEILASGLYAGTFAAEVPGGLVVARGASPAGAGSITRLDLATRTEMTLVASLPRHLDALIVEGSSVLWADGNFFSHDDYVVSRVPVMGGAAEEIVHGDERIFGSLVSDPAGVFYLVSAHPPGECESHYEGCGEMGEMVESCTAPDHHLFRSSTP